MYEGAQIEIRPLTKRDDAAIISVPVNLAISTLSSPILTACGSPVSTISDSDGHRSLGQRTDFNFAPLRIVKGLGLTVRALLACADLVHKGNCH